MRTKKDLQRLFDRAGRAEAARREREERDRVDRTGENKRAEAHHRRAVAEAPMAAERAWSWVVGADADQLRDLLRIHGLVSVMLVGWLTRDGRPLTSARFGAWSVLLPPQPGALRVEGVGTPSGGGRSRVVETADALLENAPDEVVVALVNALSDGSYVERVRESLRERLRPDVTAPNVVRLG